ncbi:unnamed protein product [Ectocarpus sp. 6 AP-2014]
MLEDWSKRDLSRDEKTELEGVANMRRLSKLAFANASVEDTVHTLPVKATEEGDAGHEEATALRAFASSEGSLSKLNFLGGLGGADNISAALVDGNDKKLMVRMVARKGESVHGAYPSHINHVVHLLRYAYRLNRPISLHEAYHPLCAAEREVLREHFGCWDDNEDDQDDYTISPVSTNFSGDKTFAMRFSLERCNEVLPVMPPTLIGVLSRDPDKYGTKLDTSSHVDTFSKVAKAFDVLKFVMDQNAVDNQGGGGQTDAAIERMYAQIKYLLHDKRLQAGALEGKISGLTGVATKTKKGRVPLVTFSNEHNLRALKLLFKGLYINGMKPLMDAIAEIDETCAGKGGWCYDILRAAEIPATNTKKKAVVTVEQLEGNAKQRLLVMKMVEALKEKGVTRKHFELASVCASVRDLFTSYPLRNQGFYYRRAAHLHVNGQNESKNPGRVVARLPGKSKVSKHGNGSGDGAAQEHVIDVDTGDWYATSNVVGRAFHRSFSGNNSIASQFIGPMDKKGNDMKPERFKGILKKIGQAYLSSENMTVNSMRTVVATLVMAECTAVGIRMDDPIIKDVASSILSSTMQKHYDAHRATIRQSRRVQRGYEGTIDFSGGAYGVVEGSEKRRLEMEKHEKGKRVVCAIEKTEEDNSDLQLQLRWCKLQLKERELQVRELELQMRERESKKNENPNVRPVGTLRARPMDLQMTTTQACTERPWLSRISSPRLK